MLGIALTSSADEEHLQAAQDAEAKGDAELASRFTGAAINLTDLPETWADYARLLLLAGEPNGDNQRSYIIPDWYFSSRKWESI